MFRRAVASPSLLSRPMRAVITRNPDHQAVLGTAAHLRLLSTVRNSSNSAAAVTVTDSTSSDSAGSGGGASRSMEGVLSLKEFLSQNRISGGGSKQGGDVTRRDPLDLAKEWKDAVADGTQTGLTFHIETYGCQMNVADSDVVRSVLMKAGHTSCDTIEEADVILTNTCAIRENAEDKVWHRLDYFQSIRNKNRKKHLRKAGYPIIGVLGCMAERLKDKMLEEKSVDFVCGPDAYRDIPRLLAATSVAEVKEANTILSFEETYADIAPVRESASSVSAFVSIMRGCNNMCTYCIVPFTRGRERSRNLKTILAEVDALRDSGVKEVMLLGQNVNGYFDNCDETKEQFPYDERKYTISTGFGKPLYRSKTQDGAGARFVDLLDVLSTRYPEMRIRFTSPHPKDFPEEVLSLIAQRNNICPQLHLPAQSGSSAVLRRMRREYTREMYLDLVRQARRIIPNVAISSDFITGFCGETEEEHQETLSLMEEVRYDMAFMFAYSLRDKTAAAYKLQDDVPEPVKLRRLQEVIAVFQKHSMEVLHETEKVGDVRLVLIEQGAVPVKANNAAVYDQIAAEMKATGDSQGPEPEQKVWMMGRTDTSHRCLISSLAPVPPSYAPSSSPTPASALVMPRVGDYVAMRIAAVQGKTVFGVPVAVTGITEFNAALEMQRGMKTDADKVQQ